MICKYFLVLILLLPMTVTAQERTIRVVDKQTGTPLVALCEHQQSSYGVRTGNDGVVKLSVSQGLIRISAEGYEPHEFYASDTISIVSLERAAIILNNSITITAKRFPQRQHLVTEAVTLIQRDEINTLMPRSTPELLIGSTGVWVQKTNHGGGSPILRGLVGNQVLLMVDGVRMNNATYRYGPNQYLSTVDAGIIGRVEVVRGAGSVLYGSDALGGVVQVLSKLPSFVSDGKSLNGNISSSWVSAGMEKSIRGELEFGSNNVAARAGLSVRDFDDLVAGGSIGTLAPSGYREYSADAKILVKTGASGVFTGAFQHHQQIDVPRYDQVQFGGYSMFKFDPQTRQLGYMRWNLATPYKTIHSLQTTVSVNRSLEGTISQRENSSDIRELKDNITTYGASVEVQSIPYKRWTALSGVEFYADHVSSTGLVVNQQTSEETTIRGNYADDATARNLAVFSSHTLDLNRFTVTLGARFNAVTLRVDDAIFGNVRIQPSAFVWNAGINYSISESVRLHASSNSAFRAPNVDDVSRFGPVESTVFEIPSVSLAPEKSMTFETGVKGRNQAFDWNISTYRTNLTNLIDRVASTYLGSDSAENRKVFQKANINKAQLSGLEGDVQWKAGNRISIHANATYTLGENTSRNEPMRRIPPMFGKLGFVYAGQNGFTCRVDLIAAGKQTRLAAGDKSDVRISSRLVNGEMPSWSVTNVYGGYSYKWLMFSAALLNIFDKEYRIYASGVDGVGRSVKVTLAAKF